MSEIENTKLNSAEQPKSRGPIEPSDLWKGVLRYWWLILIICVLTSGGMFLRSYSGFNPRYEVSATFTVNTQTLSLTGEGIPSFSTVYDNATATNLADTFPYILSSNILSDAICSDLDISYVPASLSAKVISSTNMFTLTAVGSDPQMTFDVLNSAMKNYPSVAKYLVGNVRLVVITEPVMPTQPINKFTYMVALEGLMIGLAISALWLLIYAFMRKTVKTKTDIGEKLQLEILGAIPAVTFKKYKNMQADESILITNERIGSGFLESIRIFRNQFTHLTKGNEKVVMVTSTAPGEGKTTVAVNLALSLSDIGKKVLIIDADLRNPSVAYALNLEEEPAYDEVEDDYSVANLKKYGLYYLKFTVKENSYWRLMNANYLQKMFDSLRDDYDYILVDTPPCGLVYDSSLISQVCDGVIYVVLQDAVRIKKILLGMDNLNHNGQHRILGAVINGAQSGLSGYGDNYGYSSYGKYGSYSKYGYGYGYGYGSYEYGGKHKHHHNPFHKKTGESASDDE